MLIKDTNIENFTSLLDSDIHSKMSFKIDDLIYDELSNVVELKVNDIETGILFPTQIQVSQGNHNGVILAAVYIRDKMKKYGYSKTD